MLFPTAEDAALVAQARRRNLLNGPEPGYLSPDLCTALSLLLAVPTLGFSFLLVPILWVAQSEHTAARLQTLKHRLAAASGPQRG